MAFSTGTDRETGQPLYDWGHVQQALGVILRTPIGSRPFRRDFGSELLELIDRPMTDQNILRVYAATANSIHPRIINGAQYGEPRFALTGCQLIRANGQGVLALAITGRYLPRGHEGDFTPADGVVEASFMQGFFR